MQNVFFMGAHARFQKVSTLGQVEGGGVGGVGGHSYRYQKSESAYCALDFASPTVKFWLSTFSDRKLHFV